MGAPWSRKHWIRAWAFLLVTVAFAFVGISEALNVTVFGKAGAYPFGGEGPSADYWYYRSVEKYTWVNAVSGALWLLIVLATIYAMITRNEKWLLNCVGWAIALFILELLNPLLGLFPFE